MHESSCKLELGNIKATKIITHPTKDLHLLISKRTLTLISTIPFLQVKITIYDLEQNETFRCADFAGDDNLYIVIGGDSGIIKVFDILNRKFLFYLKGHGNAVNSSKTHTQDTNIVFTGSSDNTIRMWDLKERKTIVVFGGIAGHRDLILSIDVSLCGKYLVSSSNDYTIKVWQIPDKCIKCDKYLFKDHICDKYQIFSNPFPIFSTSKIHQSFITCVRFMGTLIISKGNGNDIMVFKPDYTRKILESYSVSQSFFVEGLTVKSSKSANKFFVDQGKRLLIISDSQKKGGFHVKHFDGTNSQLNACATNVEEEIRYITYKDGYLYILYANSIFHKIRFDRFS